MSGAGGCHGRILLTGIKRVYVWWWGAFERARLERSNDHIGARTRQLPKVFFAFALGLVALFLLSLTLPRGIAVKTEPLAT